MSLRPINKRSGLSYQRKGLIPTVPGQMMQQDPARQHSVSDNDAGIGGLPTNEQEIISIHEQLEGRGNPLEHGLSDMAPFSKNAVVIVNGKPAWYIHEKFKRDTIINGNTDPFIQKREFGCVLFFEAHFDSKFDGLFVDIMGRNNSKIVLNDLLVKDMVQLGRGMTPGMVKTLPDGTSPDPAGVVDHYVPWVAKYKDTSEADGIGNTGKGFVIRYTPRYPIEYKNIRMTWRNQSGFPSLLIRAEVIRAQFLDEAELTHYGFDRL